MIETFVTAVISMFLGGVIAWKLLDWLRVGPSTSDDWESRELGKEAVVEMINMMKEHGIVELEITDSGFRIRRR